MPLPFLRIRLTNEPRDFRVVSAGAGVPLIDRFKSTDSLLLTWLGRFVAEPVFSGEHVAFYLRDDRGRQVSDIVCEQATPADLKGKFRGEFEALKTRLRQAVPPSESARAVHQFILDGLSDPKSGPDFVAWNCQFFKYLDHDGVWKLVWCPGYAPAAGKTCIRPTLCRNPECRRLITGNAETIEGLACPDCNQPFLEPPKPRHLFRKLVVAMLLLAAGGGGAWWYLYGRPTGVLVGLVRAADGRPVAGAAVRVTDTGREAVTDAEGRFRIEQAGRGGPITIEVTAAGFSKTETEARLTSNAETAVDVQMLGAAGVVGRVVYKFNGKDVPIAKVRVTASTHPTPLATDDDGRFTLTGLAAQSAVKFDVAATGFRSAKSSAVAKDADGPSLTIVLAGDGTVSGRVVYEVDPAYPIADADVSVVGLDGVKARSDSQGQFTLSGIPPMEVQVQAAAAGLLAGRTTTKPGGGAVPIKLKGDAAIAGDVIRRDTNEPVPNIEVRSADLPFVAKTDDQGRFRMDGVPNGTVRLRASTPGLVGMIAQNLTANQTTTVRLMLTGGATLRGRVVAGTDKRPVAQAVVRVADTPLEAKTDADGKYEIVEVPEAAAMLLVSAADYLSTTVPLKLSAGEQTLDDVALQPGAAVEGRVVSAVDQHPLAGAEITVVDRTEKAVADAEGKFSLGPLPLGPIAVRIAAKTFGTQVLTRELSRGAHPVGDVALQPVATVVGRIVRALDKRPIVGAEFELTAAKLKVRTNEQGEFRLEEVPYGAAVLNASAPGFLSQSLNHHLAEAELLLDDTALVGDTAADGLVFDSADKTKLIAGATVDFEIDDYKASVGSGGQGQFLLGNVPSGTVKVTARAPGYKDESVVATVKPGDARIEIPLLRLIDAKGVVIDAANRNRAVPNANVVIITGGKRHEIVSGIDGGFEIKGVMPGNVQVVVAAAGYQETTKQNVPPDQWIEVALPPLIRVEGRVRADGAGAVGNVVVTVSAGNYLQTATSDVRGNFIVQVPLGNVTVAASAAGFLDAETIHRVAGPSTVLDVRLSRASAIKGFIVDATTNGPVAGALVEATVGAVRETAVTDAQGVYVVQNLPIGAATVKFSAAGYESLSVAPTAGELENLRAVLSPTLAEGTARVVLLWSDRPRDLDAYLVGADAGGRPVHISFENRAAGETKLDIDDKDGFGPETCTIQVDAGTYRYYVAHSENIGTNDGAGLTRSTALVRVYAHGETVSRSFRVPVNPRGPVWHVCDITRNPTGKIIVTPRNEWLQNIPER